MYIFIIAFPYSRLRSVFWSKTPAGKSFSSLSFKFLEKKNQRNGNYQFIY